MNWCGECGSRTPDDATFCPACGVRLPTDGAQRTVEAALVGAGSPGVASTVSAQTQTGAATAGVAVVRGWHPDPAGRAPLRWWTGDCWSSIVVDHPRGVPVNDGSWAYDVMASWLPDPWQRAPWRWWDGATFTAHLSEGTTVWQEPQTGGSW
jgi:hypothetical protein